MIRLVKSRVRQFRNSVSQSGKRKYLLFLALGGGILMLMGYFFIRVFGYLYHQQEFPHIFKLFLAEKVLMMAFLTMFMMLVMSALVSTLNIFFMSRDLHLLLSSPIPSRTVFLWKTVEVAVSSGLMVVFFSLPMLFAYSYYFAPRILDIIAMVVIFLLFMLTGILVGIIIGMVVPAFISVKKLQPVLSVVSILFMSGLVIFLRLLRPERFGNPDVINNIVKYMSELKVDYMSYFPFAWIASGLKFLASGDTAGYFQSLGAFAGIIILFGGFILFLQKRYYLNLFDKLNKGSRGGYKSKWKPSAGDFGPLWKKEIKTFIRTPAQWSQLLIIAAIIIVFIINLKGIPMPHKSINSVVAYLNLGMAAFIVAGLNSRFTFTTIPMEYPGIVHLLASPFKRKTIYRFKLLFYTVPEFLIGMMLFFTGDIALQLDSFARVSGIIYLLPMLPFLTVLALYYSLRLEETVSLTPQHLIASRSGISYMLWSAVAVVMGMIYFARPVFIYYYSQYLKRETPVLEIASWYGAFWLVLLVLTFFYYKRSVRLWMRKEFL